MLSADDGACAAAGTFCISKDVPDRCICSWVSWLRAVLSDTSTLGMFVPVTDAAQIDVVSLKLVCMRFLEAG